MEPLMKIAKLEDLIVIYWQAIAMEIHALIVQTVFPFAMDSQKIVPQDNTQN